MVRGASFNKHGGILSMSADLFRLIDLRYFSTSSFVTGRTLNFLSVLFRTGLAGFQAKLHKGMALSRKVFRIVVKSCKNHLPS